VAPKAFGTLPISWVLSSAPTYGMPHDWTAVAPPLSKPDALPTSANVDEHAWDTSEAF
jgi:hypothetical protein